MKTLFALLLIAGFLYNVVDITTNHTSKTATHLMQIEAVMQD
jgi:hypothetical protein